MGAAAAVARLLKLDAEASARALSIATSMSAGFMSQFGTEMKPVHAGLAAKGGVMAAHLARAGVTAGRSEEHTSELQSLMRISYAVFCLKKQIILSKQRQLIRNPRT